MKLIFIFSLFIWGILSGCPSYGQTVLLNNIPFQRKQIPKFEVSLLENVVHLNVPYAKPTIINADDWSFFKREGKIPYEIDLIYTKYPYDSTKWLTAYDKLMTERVKELQKLDPSIQPEKIKWNLVAQTACSTEVLAKTFFHGWVIKYDIEDDKEDDFTALDGKIDHKKRVSNHLSQVKGIIAGRKTLKDSLAINTLNKHPEWKNMCVVIDWTSSMYAYGAQVIRWNELHLDEKRIKHLVFFNDGDDYIRKTYVKKPGSAGGIYYCNPNERDSTNSTTSKSPLERIIQTMETVMRNGDGGDIPENNCEALFYAQNNLKDFDALVMIADSKADIRDLWLLDKLKIPVHIILCGSKRQALAADYLNVAWRTKGSLTTIESAISFTAEQLKKPPMEVKIGHRRYEFDARYLKFRIKKD